MGAWQRFPTCSQSGLNVHSTKNHPKHKTEPRARVSWFEPRLSRSGPHPSQNRARQEPSVGRTIHKQIEAPGRCAFQSARGRPLQGRFVFCRLPRVCQEADPRLLKLSPSGSGVSRWHEGGKEWILSRRRVGGLASSQAWQWAVLLVSRERLERTRAHHIDIFSNGISEHSRSMRVSPAFS